VRHAKVIVSQSVCCVQQPAGSATHLTYRVSNYTGKVLSYLTNGNRICCVNGLLYVVYCIDGKVERVSENVLLVGARTVLGRCVVWVLSW